MRKIASYLDKRSEYASKIAQNIDENNRKITKLVVYKTIKTLSYIEFMLK